MVGAIGAAGSVEGLTLVALALDLLGCVYLSLLPIHLLSLSNSLSIFTKQFCGPEYEADSDCVMIMGGPACIFC